MLEIRRAISTYHIIWNPNPYSRHKAEERAFISFLMSIVGSFEYQWRHAEDKIMSFDATQHAFLRETSRWTVTRERMLSWWLPAKQLAYYICAEIEIEELTIRSSAAILIQSVSLLAEIVFITTYALDL